MTAGGDRVNGTYGPLGADLATALLGEPWRILPPLPPLLDALDAGWAECGLHTEAAVAEHLATDADERTPIDPAADAVPSAPPRDPAASDKKADRRQRLRLVLRREVKSVVGRYVQAVQRVDDAFETVECRLQKVLHDLRGRWDGASRAQAFGVEGRLNATRRRRENVRACCSGKLQMVMLRCRCCGDVQHGPPAGCNSRTCPRCVRKLRRQQMAHIGGILEQVEVRRVQAGKPKPVWRFLTLTAPSWADFVGMRRHLGAAWGRLLQRRCWSDHVRGAIACWETTHTAAGWHVHAHAIVDAYLERADLVRAWQQTQLVGFAAAIEHGAPLTGAPNDLAALAEACRSDQPRAHRLRAGARRLVRFAERWRVELLAALAAPPDGAPAGFVTEQQALHRLVPVADLAQLARACSHAGSGVHLKLPTGDRSAIVSELCKYAGKDLAGAQGDDGVYGIAGTSDRLADFIAGSFRWRTLRTYGDCYDQPALETRGECNGCGADELEFDGMRIVTAAQAKAIAEQQRAASEDRVRWRREVVRSAVATPERLATLRGRHAATPNRAPPRGASP